ncbi:MAG: aconitase family protein, partial [Planctomycetota bacterium]
MPSAPRTLLDKIWDDHVVCTPPGELPLLYIDRHLVHEVTSPQAFEGLRLAGRRLRRPEATFATPDHNVPTTDRRLPIADPISKRQVVRLLTTGLETFRAEDEAVLKAGLGGAYVTVDDTGARHAGKNGYTTQIGSYNFTTFRTGPSKSRLAFLSRLCGASLYVINDAALDYMKERNLPRVVIGKFKQHKARIFSSPEDWERHLQALGLSGLKVAPDPVLIASEGALWGAIRHQGLLADTVIVSDDAGQFRVGAHALCWIHAERLVHKLLPSNDKQRNAIEIAKRMIWWFYRALKDYKLAPSAQQAQLLRARFDRVFKRASTGFATLDRLLGRLFRN